jgi:SAM-dependent methyltransferase
VTADTRQITSTLAAFYDFSGRTVVDVGAGGGQLVEFARDARSVIAVDRDPAALGQLETRLRAAGLAERFTLVERDLQDVIAAADVVLFEFCLHQMPDPARALAHGRMLAPDVVVIDHAPGSPWSWLAAEEEQVDRGWRAVEAHSVRRRRLVVASQRFADHGELAARLAGQGPESALRLRAYRGQTPIAIAMPYQLALI